MKFLPTFLFSNIEVYYPLIRNFRVWALNKRVRSFSPASSWPIRVKNVRHSARGQNMQISTVDVTRSVASRLLQALNFISEDRVAALLF